MGLQLSSNHCPNGLIENAARSKTSFFGTDLLLIRLEGATGVLNNGRPDGAFDNAAGVLEPNFGSVLDYSIKPPTINGELGIGRLSYTFRPTQDLAVSLGPDIRATDYIDYNSYAKLSFLDFSTQAFVNNLILFPIDGPAAGAAIDWKPGQGALAVRALYAAADPANPGDQGLITGVSSFARVIYSSPQSPGAPGGANVPGGSGLPIAPGGDPEGDRGLFGNTYQGAVEVEYSPSRSFALRLQYSGGEVFDNRFDVIGANFELTFAKKFGIFGRYGYGSFDDTNFGDIEPNYWMAGIAARDLFREGALAGIAVGQPFIASEIGDATQTNYEVFYNYPLNRNIQITPTIQGEYPTLANIPFLRECRRRLKPPA